MTSFQIKILACLFMLIDHLGVLMFPEQIAFRIIGRLAFPLFAWMIATGYFHTRNVLRYLKRLIYFAVFLQIPYSFYFHSLNLNIFFTLFLGLAGIDLYRRASGKAKGWLMVLLLAGFGELIHADYGFYGVLTIFLFYFYYHDWKKLIAAQALLNLVNLGFGLSRGLVSYYSLSEIDLIQPLSLIALAVIYFYNGRQGRKFKYIFYIFYPGHLMVLYGIKLLFIKYFA